MTGFSDAQLTRLIGKKRKCRRIFADTAKRNKFSNIYTPEDVARLIETDKAHGRLSGPATKDILKREYNIFNNKKFLIHEFNFPGVIIYKFSVYSIFITTFNPVFPNCR